MQGNYQRCVMLFIAAWDTCLLAVKSMHASTKSGTKHLGPKQNVRIVDFLNWQETCETGYYCSL